MAKAQKIITGIVTGIVDGKCAWVIQYANGTHESFAVHPGVAQQFIQALQETLAQITPEPVSGEQEQASPIWDGVGIRDSVRMHLKEH